MAQKKKGYQPASIPADITDCSGQGFEEIDLGAGGTPSGEAAFDEGAGVESFGAEVPDEAFAAADQLAQRLMLDSNAVSLAASAETGTESHGLENVVAIAVGQKLVGSEHTDETCVTVYVVAKVDASAVAFEAQVPSDINGIPTDVVEVGEICTQPFRGRYRPAPGGVSVGHFRITAGTIGCLVRRGTRLYILSNNHVLANSNHAAIGDAILQPGPYDGGRNPQDLIARLSAFVPIKLAPGTTNQVDAAIAQTRPALVSAANIGFGRISATTVAPTMNLLVKKAGRTTQRTAGRIVGLNATVNVGGYGPRPAVFTGQMIIRSVTTRPFSQGGDSGSLIMTQTGNRPVGLLFAGNSVVTIANPIRTVLAQPQFGGITIVA